MVASRWVAVTATSRLEDLGQGAAGVVIGVVEGAGGLGGDGLGR